MGIARKIRLDGLFHHPDRADPRRDPEAKDEFDGSGQRHADLSSIESRRVGASARRGSIPENGRTMVARAETDLSDTGRARSGTNLRERSADVVHQ
ncbi:hypothetical protein JCM16408A_34100 [Methylobacterium phyllosphaerae]